MIAYMHLPFDDVRYRSIHPMLASIIFFFVANEKCGPVRSKTVARLNRSDVGLGRSKTRPDLPILTLLANNHNSLTKQHHHIQQQIIITYHNLSAIWLVSM